MDFHFTIGKEWLEFFCHFMAAFFYVAFGIEIATKASAGIYLFILAIAMTFIGTQI
jgi:hypothetical protein